MGNKKLSNIPLRHFRDFLKDCGLKHIRTKAGHEVWSGNNLPRPVILQTHIDPVPEFIVKNTLRNIGKTADDFYAFFSK